jgi:hypothetical protein
MTNLKVLFAALGVLVLLHSCKHEIPEPENDTIKKWRIDTIIDRGDILDLGVSKSVICFENAKPEVGVVDLNTGVIKFFNRFNSPLVDLAQIKAVDDSLVLLCSEANGLFSLNHSGLTVYDSSERFMGFDYSGDSCWATKFGVFVQSNGAVYKLANSFGFGFNRMADMAAIGTTCWVGTVRGGVYEIEMPTRHLALWERGKLGSDSVMQTFVDDDQRLWVVNRRGITTYFQKKWKVSNTKNGLKLNHVIIVDNVVYVATDWGVYQFDPENETYLPVKEINDLLPKGRVNVIEADGQKRLWLGTHNGLFQLSPVPN